VTSEAKAPTIRRQEAQATREDILDVATREFSDKGLAGARIDEIAERTATSKRMIYYYFGGKEELYRAVLERAYERIRAQEQEADFESLAPDQALRAMIGHNFDYHFEHPEFVRLVMNENVHHGEHIAQIDSLKQRNRSVIDQLGAILSKGAGQGLFRPGIDPVELHTTISALSFYNVSNRHTFLHNFGVDFTAPATKAKRREQIIDCVLGWVQLR
jgi:AcrR family transcriptional regulator